MKALEHQILAQCRSEGLSGSHWLLALSGGLDSMCLAHIALELQASLQLQLSIQYVHHGNSASKEISDYRIKAQAHVKAFAEKHRLDFFTNVDGPKQKLTSEADLRDWRFINLRSTQVRLRASGSDRPLWLVTAHHLNDLLETRMMRLIRGTGSTGFQAMLLKDEQQRLLRPLLKVTRGELQSYADERQVTWVEDPSNNDQGTFRNWLRQSWFRQLEDHSPGSIRRLGLSMQQLQDSLPDASHAVAVERRLNRNEFNLLSRNDKKQHIVTYLKRQGVKNYTQNHVEELLKRLDTPRNEFKFSLLKLDWKVTSKHIWTAGS